MPASEKKAGGIRPYIGGWSLRSCRIAESDLIQCLFLAGLMLSDGETVTIGTRSKVTTVLAVRYAHKPANHYVPPSSLHLHRDLYLESADHVSS